MEVQEAQFLYTQMQRPRSRTVAEELELPKHWSYIHNRT